MRNPLRKLSAFVLSALLAAGVFALPMGQLSVRAADAPPADSQIPAGQYSAAPSDGQDGSVLLDANRASSLKLGAGTSVAITGSTPFDGIYLVWDAPPSGHEVMAGGETLPGTTYGAIHEYIKLSAPVTEASLNLTAAEYTLCDVYLFAGDDLPDFVQVWQPPLEEADLLALPTHADDEHLFFGGTLPTYAGERGLDVQVVYMTNHWGEAYRPHELLSGLWEVGVTSYPIMGPFPDLYASKENVAAAEQTFGRNEVLAFQVEMLRRFKPKVVVAHDINGEYGHGAHILNAQTLLEALPLANDAAAFPESAAQYGTYEVSKAYLHLWTENQIVMDWNVPLERFGGKTAFEMAESGFAKHVSQVDYFTVQQSGTWEDCRLFGLAHTTVGPDVAGGDFFENIDLTPEPVPEPEPAPQPVTEEPPNTPTVMPEDPADTEKGFPTVAVIIIAAVAAVIIIAVLLIVAENNRRKKRRRAAARREGKNTYYRKQ